MKHNVDLGDPASERVGSGRPPPPPIVLIGRRPDDADAGIAALERSDYANMVRLARELTGSEVGARQIVGEAFEEVRRRWGRLADPVDALRTGVVDGARSYLAPSPAGRRPASRLRRLSAAGVPRLLAAVARFRRHCRRSNGARRRCQPSSPVTSSTMLVP